MGKRGETESIMKVDRSQLVSRWRAHNQMRSRSAATGRLVYVDIAEMLLGPSGT